MSLFGRTRFNCIDVIFSLTVANSNPGEEILDILCEKPDVTVHRLIYLLECAELTSVLDIVRQTLGNILTYIVINQKSKMWSSGKGLWWSSGKGVWWLSV